MGAIMIFITIWSLAMSDNYCTMQCRRDVLRNFEAGKTHMNEMKALVASGNVDKFFKGPKLIIIGAQKAATTDLSNQLQARGVLGRAPYPNNVFVKETHFLDYCMGVKCMMNSQIFETNQSSVWCDGNQYLGLFENCKSKTKMCADVSPSYMMYPEMAALVRVLFSQSNSTLSSVSFVAVLREPISRAISSYFQYRHLIDSLGYTLPDEHQSFEQAIQSDVQILKHCAQTTSDLVLRYQNCIWPQFLEKASSIEFKRKEGNAGDSDMKCRTSLTLLQGFLIRGVYVGQLHSWLRHFPRKVTVISHDLYTTSPEMAIKKVVVEGLGLDWSQYSAAPKKIHSSKSKNSKTPTDFSLSNAARSYLTKLFNPYNQALYEMLKENLILDFPEFQTYSS
eukprot:m.125773 g.125773  ORF g.125773 m.125773 type:complete len:393 (-) comp14500_c0_seq1:47-1225(-)